MWQLADSRPLWLHGHSVSVYRSILDCFLIEWINARVGACGTKPRKPEGWDFVHTPIFNAIELFAMRQVDLPRHRCGYVAPQSQPLSAALTRDAWRQDQTSFHDVWDAMRMLHLPHPLFHVSLL